MNPEKLTESLKGHEGTKLVPYTDTNGHQTLGTGHNLERPISQAAADQILQDDIDIAVAELNRTVPSWRQHSDARQNVLAELMFAMGAPTFGQFTRFWFAMSQKNYDSAAAELLNSRWASQVHSRADTLARRLREDSFL